MQHTNQLLSARVLLCERLHSTNGKIKEFSDQANITFSMFILMCLSLVTKLLENYN